MAAELARALGETRSEAVLDTAARLATAAPSARAEFALATAAIAHRLSDECPDRIVERLQGLLSALAPGSAEEKAVRAALAEGREKASAGRPPLELLERWLNRVRQQLPDGARLVLHVDCGPESQATAGTITVRVGGRPWVWQTARSEHPVNASVLYHEAAVPVDISGLDPDASYEVGVAWWDCDGNGRTQSIWAGQPCLLPCRALPNGTAGDLLAQIRMPLPVGTTSTRLAIRREGRSNAVLGALWLVQRPAAPPSSVGGRRRVRVATGDEYPGHP